LKSVNQPVTIVPEVEKKITYFESKVIDFESEVINFESKKILYYA